MAYCLLARDRAAGTVTVLSPASFDRSEEAVEAARALVVSGVADPDPTEILVVDLSGVPRVEFITLPVPIDEPMAEEIDLAPAAGVWETSAEALESPERVEEPEPEPALEPELEPEPELAPEPLPEPEMAPVPEPQPQVVFAHGSEPALEPESEPEPEVGAAPVADDTSVPEPEPEPLLLPVPVDEGPAAETSSLVAVEPELVAPTLITEVTIVESLPVVELDVGPYEVSGELILDRYTCDDCVYANTCPKVGESAPADCGSFQWKAL